MTDQEKAETIAKALKKAIDCGLTGYWADRYKRCVELDEIEFIAAGNIYEEGHSLDELTHSHDFAKALWGTLEVDWECRQCQIVHQLYDEGQFDLELDDPWKFHLQQMVIALDPIEYLKENI